MRHRPALTLLAAIAIAAGLPSCSSASTPTGRAPDEVPLVGGAGQPSASTAGTAATAPPLPTARGKLFAGSGVCAKCHRDAKNDAGQDVAIPTAWRATMMGNAATDPYWRASVQAEVAAAPKLASVIEDKCATCHTPMARSTDAVAGGHGKLLGGYFERSHPLHPLAQDGVSCTVCHQIEPTGLGSKATFSGKFRFDTSKPAGARVVYGKHVTPPADAARMQRDSGYRPEQGKHLDAALCGSCHTLFTPYLDDRGKVAGELPEQTTYLEYRRSDWADSQACPTCHMPPARRRGRRFSQHHFVGGNAWMLRILTANAAELGVKASEPQLLAAIDRTLERLTSAASLSIEHAELTGNALALQVLVQPYTGHRLPTGFPSRRAWLHLAVVDGGGKMVFESGKPRADGAIAGNDNDQDARAFEPHHAVIDAPDEVQIYESVMGDVNGQVTTRLLRGARYLKDNRLLPRGLRRSELDQAVAIAGKAADDADFRAGADRVRFQVPIGAARGPFTVTVELLYQSVGYRWRENLRATKGAQVKAFLSASDKVPNTPVLITRQSRLVK